MKSLRSKYPDWDEPSPENEELCRRFSYELWDKSEQKLPYRMFLPDVGEKKHPLVIFLHGADTVGDDNEAQLMMHDIGTILVRPSWQKKQPAAVIAPQYGKAMHWARADVAESVLLLVRAALKKYPALDPERVYIYGYSAGGMGTLELLKKAPALFAGAVVICGATYQDRLEELKETPLWLLHAEDDRIVSPGESPGFGVRYYGSTALYDALHEKMGVRLHYTRYPAGEMKEKYKLNPHCAWVPAGKDQSVWHWLFAQKKKNHEEVI